MDSSSLLFVFDVFGLKYPRIKFKKKPVRLTEIQLNKQYNNLVLQYLNSVVRYLIFEYHIDQIMLYFLQSSKSIVTINIFRTRLIKKNKITIQKSPSPFP
jgi:hypothetical protein